MATNGSFVPVEKWWHFAAAWFAFVVAAKEAPDVIQTAIPWFEVEKTCAMWIFIGITVALLRLGQLFTGVSRQPQSVNTMPTAAQIAKKMKWVNVKRGIFSLGLIPLRETLLDLFDVGLYHSFRRPTMDQFKNSPEVGKLIAWVDEPLRFSFVDRFSFEKSGQYTGGAEFQYSRDFSKMFIRYTENGASDFKPVEERGPTLREGALLMIGSNFFPLWLIGFIVLKPLWFVKRLAGKT
jgi:hypothetical protein